jgi:hypothetical protein
MIIKKIKTITAITILVHYTVFKVSGFPKYPVVKK